MRRSKDDKAVSHRAIVEQAAQLFRERGIEPTSIADVMQAARMTHGGFYRHFQSKDDLVGAAMEQAVAEILSELSQERPEAQAPTVIDRFVSKYLSDGHVNNPRIGCPIAALAGDAGRIGGQLAETMADGIERIVAAIATHLPGSRQAARDRAAVMFATLVGAVVLARASGSAEIGKDILSAGRRKLDV